MLQDVYVLELRIPNQEDKDKSMLFHVNDPFLLTDGNINAMIYRKKLDNWIQLGFFKTHEGLEEFKKFFIENFSDTYESWIKSYYS